MTAPRSDWRSPRGFQPPRFHGTRELKFSQVEQAAIRDAETALGYRARPRVPAVAPGAEFSAFVRFLLGLFLLFGLLAAIGHLIHTHSSPDQQPQVAARISVARSPRAAVESGGGNATVPAPSALPVVAAAPPLPQSTIYTKVGNGVAASPSEGIGGTGNVAAASPMPTIPQPQSPAPMLAATDSMPTVAATAPAATTTTAEPIATGSLREGFGSAKPASTDSGWHRFSSPRSASADGGWHTFGDHQPDLASAEASPSNRLPGSWKRFKHRSPKRHSFLRRLVGGVGHVLAGVAKGVAKGVAAPLVELTQGFRVPPLPFPYLQPIALPMWTEPYGLQAPAWAFPNVAPPGAEGRSQP